VQWNDDAPKLEALDPGGPLGWQAVEESNDARGTETLRRVDPGGLSVTVTRPKPHEVKRISSPDRFLSRYVPRGDQLYLVWAGGLTLAYLACWWATRAHGASIWRLEEAFDRFAAAERIAPVPPVKADVALPRWWIAGGILLYLGCAWAPAAMIAGASRRNLTLSETADLRAKMAAAVKEMSTLRGATAGPLTTCSRDRCGSPIPSGARFCPRCGGAVTLLA
jgi:hypothetical protein